MKSPLAIHILTKNNADTIDTLIYSLNQINCNFYIADIGSSDGTLEKLIKYNPKISKFSLGDDISLIRNQTISKIENAWILYLEPYESIISGLENLVKVVSGPVSAYNIGVLQGNILTRQIRLWHSSLGYKFTNPVFETVEGESQFLNCFISSSPPNKNFYDTNDLLQKWHKRSLLKPDPFYYMACNELTNQKWESFKIGRAHV